MHEREANGLELMLVSSHLGVLAEIRANVSHKGEISSAMNEGLGRWCCLTCPSLWMRSFARHINISIVALQQGISV